MKPLLCSLDWHTRRFRDSALFNSADRCEKCDEWVDPNDGALVDQERALWASGDLRPDMTYLDLLAAFTRAGEGGS